MTTFSLFLDFAKKAAEKIKDKKHIRIVSHFDSDGITAASLLIFTLKKLKVRYSLTIVRQLDEKTLKGFSKEDYDLFIFSDLGSGYIEKISQCISKDVIILDHHLFSRAEADNIINVNPNLFGIDGGKELSASGVVWYFCNSLVDLSEKAYLAVIGAVGDQQDKGGFSEYNQKILDTALSYGSLEFQKGLRFFGTQTRSIYRLLYNSTDPYIEGISGNSEKAIEFVESLGLQKDMKISELTEDEMKTFIGAIKEKRSNEKDPNDIFTTHLMLCNEKTGSPFKEVKEYSTLLNACGKLGKGSIGVSACLESKRGREKAREILHDYKRNLLIAIRWYEDNKKSEYIKEDERFVIINTRAHVDPGIIGTFSSMLMYSTPYDYVIALAQNVDGTTKISARKNDSTDASLNKILAGIVTTIGGESGGHKNAAGALINTADEEKFISALTESLEKITIEEKID